MKTRLSVLVVLLCSLPFAAGAQQSPVPAPAEAVPPVEQPAAPAVAMQAESALSPGKLDPLLARVPFGLPSADALDALRSALEERARPRMMATADARERDEIKRELDRMIEGMDKGRVSFEGQEVGYNSSVLMGEFRHRAGESVFVFQEGRRQTYFFLAHDVLWKILVSEESRQSFSALLAQLARLYGRPAEIEYADPEAQEGPRHAAWEDDRFVVYAEDRRAVFGSDVVKWEYKPMLDRIAEWRQGTQGSQPVPSGATSTEDLMKRISGGENDTGVDSIVDDLTGRHKEEPASATPQKPVKKPKKGKSK